MLYLLVFAVDASACDTSCVYTRTGNFYYYNGTVSTSTWGTTCHNWQYNNETNGVSTTHNFCRNADGNTESMWCYIDDTQTAWNYCDTGSLECPLCSNPPNPPTPAVSTTYPCLYPPTPSLDPRI